MEIYIKIDSLNDSKRVYVNSKTNVVEYNGKPVKLDAEYYLDRLDLITKNWEDYYEDPFIIDGIEYRIKIVYNGTKERVIVCKNKFPKNFYSFRWLMEEIENASNN